MLFLYNCGKCVQSGWRNRLGGIFTTSRKASCPRLWGPFNPVFCPKELSYFLDRCTANSRKVLICTEKADKYCKLGRSSTTSHDVKWTLQGIQSLEEHRRRKRSLTLWPWRIGSGQEYLRWAQNCTSDLGAMMTFVLACVQSSFWHHTRTLSEALFGKVNSILIGVYLSYKAE